MHKKYNVCSRVLRFKCFLSENTHAFYSIKRKCYNQISNKNCFIYSGKFKFVTFRQLVITGFKFNCKLNLNVIIYFEINCLTVNLTQFKKNFDLSYKTIYIIIKLQIL